MSAADKIAARRPERIWARPDYRECWLKRGEEEDVEYVRADLADAQAQEIERLRAALAWYGEQARLCRLIHSEGDAGRHALDNDGGKRARAALGDAP